MKSCRPDSIFVLLAITSLGATGCNSKLSAVMGQKKSGGAEASDRSIRAVESPLPEASPVPNPTPSGTPNPIPTIIPDPISWKDCPTSLSLQEGTTFQAIGGTPPLQYSLVSGLGTIDAASGVYRRAWSTVPGTIRVTDALGVSADCGPVSLSAGIVQLGIPLTSGGDDNIGGMATDDQGNIYFSAVTAGSWPGFSANGGNDMILVKTDPVGRKLWAIQFGSSGADSAGHVRLSSDKQFIFVVGTVAGAVATAPGLGGTDVFIGKFRTIDGSEIWKKVWGGAGNDSSLRLAVSSQGKVWITGSTTDSVKNGVSNLGLKDAFLARFDGETGSEEFVDQVGTASDEFGGESGGIAVAKNGDVVTMFRVGSPFLGDAYPGAYPSAIILRDAAGQIKWKVPSQCTSGQDSGLDFAPDGAVLVLLNCTQAVTGATPPNTSPLYAMVSKLSVSDGSGIWVNEEGALGNNYTQGFAVGADGAVFVASISAGASYAGLPNPGGFSALMYKLTPDGQTQWRVFEGVPEVDYVFQPAILPSGDPVVVRNQCRHASSGWNPEDGGLCMEVRSAINGERI